MFDLAPAQNTVFNMSAITASGASVGLTPDQSPSTVYVGTGGSAVNLGANSYTLSYTSTPPTGTGFDLYFNATQLTAPPANVTLFGYQPLVKAPGIGNYHLRYDWNGATVTVTCYQDAAKATTIINSATFNAGAYFNDSIVAQGPSKFYGALQIASASSHGPDSVGVQMNDSGVVSRGCTPWCTTGNGGLAMQDYLGSNDTSGVNFGWDGLPAGRIDGNLGNAFFGLEAGHKNTTGTSNTAIGALSMNANTTGQNNASFGTGTMLANTTGSYNTALGQDALPANTTGSYNTAVGQGSLITNTTGSYNSTLGYNVNPNTATAHNGIGIGANAVYSTNQCAIAGVENLYLNGVNSGVGYHLVDTSGTGNFVPQKLFGNSGSYFTPSTGDSISITNGKNTINPSGTIANLTILFPANPIAYQTYFFSFTQVVSALHYSVRFSGGGNPAGLPSSAAQYATFSAYWEPNLNTWIPASH